MPLTVDHIVPQSNHGRDSHVNLGLACATCNTAKGSGTLETLESRLKRNAQDIIRGLARDIIKGSKSDGKIRRYRQFALHEVLDSFGVNDDGTELEINNVTLNMNNIHDAALITRLFSKRKGHKTRAYDASYLNFPKVEQFDPEALFLWLSHKMHQIIKLS